MRYRVKYSLSLYDYWISSLALGFTILRAQNAMLNCKREEKGNQALCQEAKRNRKSKQTSDSQTRNPDAVFKYAWANGYFTWLMLRFSFSSSSTSALSFALDLVRCVRVRARQPLCAHRWNLEFCACQKTRNGSFVFAHFRNALSEEYMLYCT